MRDCLYIWNDPKECYIVASGVTFGDMVRFIKPEKGVLLLSHEYDHAKYYGDSGFGYVPKSGFRKLLAEDTYSWGDLVWADVNFRGKLPECDVASLLYFRHKAAPYSFFRNRPHVTFDGMANGYLVHQHDDGWFVKMYYSPVLSDMGWGFVRHMVDLAAGRGRVDACIDPVMGGDHALWVSPTEMSLERRTMDVDSVLRGHWDKKKKSYV